MHTIVFCSRTTFTSAHLSHFDTEKDVNNKDRRKTQREMRLRHEIPIKR